MSIFVSLAFEEILTSGEIVGKSGGAVISGNEIFKSVEWFNETGLGVANDFKISGSIPVLSHFLT
jgi:hypothetical protein